MRKKGILGNFIKNPGVICSHLIKKLDGEAEAYAALIEFLPGCRELKSEINGSQICLAGAGYKWLMYLPMNEYWCLSAYYTPDNELIGWYFDISTRNYLDGDGTPCTDDIFLDIAISADGHIATLDADELQDALDKGEIACDDFNHAYKIHDQIKNSEWVDVNFLKKLFDKLLLNFDT